VRRLTCCVCGGDAGRFQQWWNRDTGFGVCAKCIARIRALGKTTEEEIRFCYGVEGTHFEKAAA
jgi:hypothetical protein